MTASIEILAARAVEGNVVKGRDAEILRSMLDRALQYNGKLTERQADYARSILQRATQRTTHVAAARETVDLSRINTMFDKASQRLKNPFCFFLVEGQEFKIAAAGAASANPGFLYIKQGGTYSGKISPQGVFSPSREAPAGVLSALKAFAVDPMAAAIAYGQETKRCARCGQKLTNPVSVEAGMGPICRSFFA